jgi:50S ribosomal subunit-associated GTPase HflX
VPPLPGSSGHKIDRFEDKKFLRDFILSFKKQKLDPIPVSAQTGEGMDKLRSELKRLLKHATDRKAAKKTVARKKPAKPAPAKKKKAAKKTKKAAAKKPVRRKSR